LDGALLEQMYLDLVHAAPPSARAPASRSARCPRTPDIPLMP
jgi:hypothetical protein